MIEDKSTEAPGPRSQITLDIADVSLAILREGQDVARVWLDEQPDGTYRLGADAQVGVTRTSGVKPYTDVVVESVNDLLAVLDEHAENVPRVVLDARDRAVRRAREYQGEAEDR